MNKIEQHISKQVEVMDSWTKAAPEIRQAILSQKNQIAALQAKLDKALSRIEALEKRRFLPF